MAAGLGFKTFAVGDVLTAADTNGYLMQGVLVFASAVARDAAITSPQEGQFAYLKDTNVTTYYTGSAWANLDTTGMTNPLTTTGDTIYSSSGSTPARLAIGSTGQVMTVAGGVPSWATANTSAMSQISTSTLGSAAADFTFSSIPSTYNHLMLIIAGISAGSYNGLSLKVQLNSDTGANYAHARNTIYAGNGTAITLGAATGQTSMDMGTIWAGVAQAGNVGAVQMIFPSYKETTLYKNMIFNGGTWSDGGGCGQGWCRWGNTAAVTTIKVFSTQNFAIGTTATLYGMS